MVVKSVGVASVAKMYGAISAGVGLLIGVCIALASMVGAGFADTGDVAMFAPIFGVGAVVIMPILYGVMGAIGGALGAILYNVFAGMVGGVTLNTE
jgi:hypothetical protein